MGITDTEPSGSATTTYESGAKRGAPDLRFLHYNDVYHVEPGSREPIGGIARFKTLCDYYQAEKNFPGQPDLLTFFSGDAFNPSLESSVTKGKHMLGALNAIHTSVACLGNHDLDFGVEQFRYLAERCTFPWLCANVLDPALGEDIPLGNCKRTVMLESSNGIKIGVVGVVEREWLDTINTLPPNLRYLSASATVAKLAPKLRAEGAEIVIAVSHQRQPNDDKLASKLEPGTIDLILGGHDHFYAHSIINGTHVLRSGSDFKQLSYLECRRRADGSKGWNVDIVRRDVIGAIPEEPAAVEIVKKITTGLMSKLEKPIGYTVAPLDARFTTVRLKESNMGNFVCDLMRFHYATDCCIMAAGTIRGDQIYPPGVLKVKDILNCFPFEDPCVVIALKGECILQALENAVSKYPALEGRFVQISGITMTFDPKLEPGKRCSQVYIGEHPIDLKREYTLATRDYMVRGKDGFTSLMLEGEGGGTARSIVSDENGVLLSMILRQYFMSLKALGKWRRWGEQMGQHWSKVHQGMHVVQPPVREAQMGITRDVTSGLDLLSSEEGGLQLDGNRRASRVIPSQHQTQVKEKEEEEGVQQRATKHRRIASNLSSDSEEDDEASRTDTQLDNPSEEREMMLKRKVMRKWWRLAGMKHHPNMVEQEGEGFGVLWTKGVCPKVEGRIVIVGEEI